MQGDPQIAEKSEQIGAQAKNVYILIYMPLLIELFCKYARCPDPDCDSPNVGINLNSSKKKGLCNISTVVCSDCSYESEYVTSNKQSQHARAGAGMQFFYINLRTVFAFREKENGKRSGSYCEFLSDHEYAEAIYADSL